MARSTIRTHTRVLVLVHSHHSEDPKQDQHARQAIDLSNDTISFRTVKTIKGVGSMTLDVVPNKNYFNVIYPNDVVNLYVDPGDGRGFVRVFFGYIDKVERTEVTNDKEGSVNSMFRVVCSDFQKAFEKTIVQVNASLQDRVNLVEEEYLVTGSGTGLMTAGVKISGSPADIVENLASMLLGFGAQWVLPTGYARNSKVIIDNRQRRLNRAADRVPGDVLRGLAAINILSFKSAESGIGPEIRDFSTFAKLEEAINVANVPQGKDKNQIETLEQDKSNGKALRPGRLPHNVFARIRGGLDSLREYHTILRDVELEVTTLLDLIDMSFIEASAIDGYIHDQAIWNQGGSIASMMKKFSNEIINEMIFDLRPVAISGKNSSLDTSKYLDRCFGEEYSTYPDELRMNTTINAGVWKGSDQAIQYIPTITFREYPWSTVTGTDLGSISNVAGDHSQEIGFVPFGPIFSQKADGDHPKRQYRALYDYDDVAEVREGTTSISSIGCQFAGPKMKHLDVLTITGADVIAATIGRSDNDTTNFFSMYAESPHGKNYKNILKEFMPITNPISIARNGLRSKEYPSRFASYSRDQLCYGENDVNPATEQTLRNMVRWLLLLDHWEQHKIEYLTGEIKLRAFPELRVGYRLDWLERKESYYVESVSHSWAYGKEMVTSVQVSRGQRNDPFLSYIPPASARLSIGENSVEGGDRGHRGRLATFFDVLNTPATYRSTRADRAGDLIAANADIGNVKDEDFHSPYAAVFDFHRYAGNVIYAFGIRDTAKNIKNLIEVKAETPVSRANKEVIANQQGTTEQLPAEEVPRKRPFKRASRRYDDLFEEIGGAASNPIPVEFLRALCKNESGFNASNAKGPAWGLMQVGVDGFPDGSYAPLDPPNAPKGVSGGVLKSWNSKKLTSYLPADVLDARLNITICVDLLSRVIGVLRSEGLNFQWNSPDSVGLLIAGWNAGYSKKGGVGLMINWMVRNGHDVTLENMVNLVGTQRADPAEKYNASKFLAWKKKYKLWKQVRDDYDKERGK